jgi:hypothetical protein
VRLTWVPSMSGLGEAVNPRICGGGLPPVTTTVTVPEDPVTTVAGAEPDPSRGEKAET